ncbi:tripartite tricarboxylate transporter permease [Halomonas sp. HK25]|uniref:tripartite tricarboxylate transporter permease n=1 Tax=Halomonas sp. HK25 TaxID=3394321 RepID=UPI0039FC5CCE
MDFFSNLALGLQTAISVEALLFCFIGVTIGTFVGVLPGVGSLTAISLALPLTFYMDPTVALIMLAGIFYGSQYGGSTAAILLNLPGSASSAVSCLDGNPMAKQGKGGVALFVTAIASFVGSTFAIILVMSLAPAIASMALQFSSVEYFSVMLLALVGASTLAGGSALKGIAAVILGLVFGLVGIDINSGVERFTFGVMSLSEGFTLVAMAIGLFGVSEIISNVGRTQVVSAVKTRDLSFRSMLPSKSEWRSMVKPAARGSVIGSIVGALPGSGPSIAAFLSYGVEKRVAKNPERFGNGAIEGITAPEAANNASVQSAFIPTLSLGVPGDAVTAVLLGAMMIHGIVPGPLFLTEQPAMFWGLIVSFWIGNFFLLVLNIPLIKLWVKMLSIPYGVLYPSILTFICIGVYSVNNNIFDVFVVLFFGVIGYFMRIFGFPAAPVLLGFILGPMMEEHFRRALLISRGEFSVFIERPVSLVFLILTVLLLAAPARSILSYLFSRRRIVRRSAR